MAVTVDTGFAIPEYSTGRRSFSPDAAFVADRSSTDDMRFIQGSRILAVEIRSEYDYGQAVEVEMAANRAVSLQEGTLVVWDVVPMGECVHVSHAEPASPGWRMAMDRNLPRSVRVVRQRGVIS